MEFLGHRTKMFLQASIVRIPEQLVLSSFLGQGSFLSQAAKLFLLKPAHLYDRARATINKIWRQ